MRLCFSVAVYENICVVSVSAQEDSLVIYLLDGLPRYFLDNFEKLSELQSRSLCMWVGKKPTVLVMPSLNRSMSISPSACSHSGRMLKTRVNADFSEDSLS